MRDEEGDNSSPFREDSGDGRRLQTLLRRFETDIEKMTESSANVLKEKPFTP